MVKVPAGKFLYGEDKEEKELGDFYIDLYPVTNAEYKAFVDATGQPEPASWRDHTWPKGKENHPVVEINWKSAAAYAAWAGKRLPTDEEWEKAARGTDGRTWPWGDEWDIKKANVFSGDTTPVGQYSPAGDSPFGAADMAGNVWEWCASAYAAYPYQDSDGRNNPNGTDVRVVRGGSWHDLRNDLRCANRFRFAPSDRLINVGFRCASTAF
jgi:formylglycine-generating enzyme required for sulfatase activity